MPDVVGALALVLLLAAAWRHLSPSRELGVSLLAVALVLTVGLVPLDTALTAAGRLAPVVCFLVAILVVGEVCDRAGVFAAAAGVVRRAGSPQRLLLATAAVAALVTAVLSLDATVVLLTPVAVAAARSLGAHPGPAAWISLRMANSASLLLPVSNLTNLLAMPHLDLTFLGFAAAMAPVWLAVVLVEVAVARVQLRGELGRTVPPTAYDARAVAPWVPATAVLVMLAAFAATSPWHVDPAWVAGATALGLGGWAWRRGLLTPGEAVRAGSPSFAVFVLALGIVVAGLTTGGLGDLVAALLPARADLVGLLAVAALATAASALLTNLSATLLLVPLVAPLGIDAVLAALIGLGTGAGMLYTGSLANLLWRRTLLARGEQADLARFHRLSVVSTPLALVVGVGVLHWT